MKAFLSISLFFVLCILQAQDIPDTQIHFAKSAYTLSDLFDEIEQSHALRFQYKADWIENLSYYPESPQILLEDFLESLKKQLGLSLLFKEPRYIILLGAPAAPASKAAAAQTGSSAERVRVGDISKSPEADARLYGVVREGQSAKPLSGASISIQGTALGTVTDEQGRYELILKPGTYNIRYSYVNLQAMEFELSIFNSGSFDVDMYEDITMLSAIMVKARAETANVSEASMGRTVMDQEEIRRIPAFLGEVDVNRVVLSLPGVVSVGEGAPGFNVRGGMVSQNLVLMDEIPIYNTSHLAGFFSAYNPDLVDEIKFYRGGIPAQFGGRVSSVLDISLQEANYEKWSGGGGAGLIASRFNISGPIKKNQTAFTAGMRGAYPNYIIRSLPDIELRNSDAYFYDLNFKVDHRNEKGQYLGVSAYKSRDNIDFAGNALYDYGNTGISFRLASPLGTYGLVKGSYVISQYDYTLAGGELDRAFELNSLLGDNRINLSYSYFGFNRHEIEFGAQLFSYNIQPGNYRPLVDGTLESVLLPHERAIESGIYLQDEIDVSNQLKLSVGIRYSRFNRIGPSSQLLYAAGRPTAESAIVDTIQYASGESMAKYGGLEPRLFVTYIMSPNQSLKLGYHRTRQFIHLVTNTTAVTPVDLW
ncbi:MAG TPA: TonB-dependent receptor, partial [Cyclobacteriaceae bacterium]|nr:TonB-dependent receptor [Cyclobacteriaceae bacterium]